MNETLRLTLMVLAVSAVIGVVLGIADLIFGWGFGLILDYIGYWGINDSIASRR